MAPEALVEDVTLLAKVWPNEDDFAVAVASCCRALEQVASGKVTPDALVGSLDGWWSHHFQLRRAQGEKAVLRVVFRPREGYVEDEDTVEIEINRSKEGVLESLNGEDTRNMLIYIADKVMKKKGYLTEIDSAIGDGDHGIGMYGGMKKVKKKLLTMTGEENVYKLFEEAGIQMLNSMGGHPGLFSAVCIWQELRGWRLGVR